MTEYKAVSPKSPLESAIAKKIFDHATDRKTCFVFPTQVSADSWAEASLGRPDTVAIEMERFLGWDMFLDRITRKNIPQGKKKADSRSRLLWALLTLDEQSKKPFLRHLLKPGTTPSLSQAASFASLAPALRDLTFELRQLPSGHSISEDERGDYFTLSSKYDRFLDNESLYESGHLSPAKDEAIRYILFEPSLMPGYGKRAEILSGLLSVEIFTRSGPGERKSDEASGSNRGESYGCGDGGKDGPAGDSGIVLIKYATFREELQSLFANCASLLDGGLQPADIAISIPAPTPEIQAHIRLLARQYALPIDFRFGEALSAFPFGRILLSLSRAASEGFSLRTLRKLFDKGALRWKNESTALDLIHFATRYNIPEFSIDRHYMSELWRRTFSLCPDPGAQVIALYASLNKAAHSIEGARSFDALRRALQDFKGVFLEEPETDSETDRSLQRILEELEALDQWHSHMGHPDLAASPLDALLLALDATRYKSAGTINAISVFPYHIGMLIASPIHFVLDVSQDSLGSALGYFSRVPREMRTRLGEADIGEALLSSFNAVNAVYCHAEKGLSGYSVPHPYFARLEARQVKVGRERIPEPADAAESRAWRDSAASALPARLPACRKDAAMGSFSAKSHDEPRSSSEATRELLFPPPALCGFSHPSGRKLNPLQLLKLPSCDASPHFKVSPAKLKNLMQCPFKWLLTCVPNVDGGPSAVANLAEGSLTHAMIRSLLQEIALADGSFAPAKIDEYAQKIDAAFRRSIIQVLKQNGPSLEPTLDAALPKIRDRIARILDFETDFSAAGWEIGDFETTLTRKYEALDLSLEGRADRISTRLSDDASASRGGEEYAIIDYKKKNTPRKKDFLADENGQLHDFQIASYAAMLEGEDKSVGLALYWSIEESKAVIVFGSGGGRPDSKAFEPERVALDASLLKASRTIKGGSFMSITPTPEGCAECPIRPICRAHFSSERL
ncbi:MAG TPA: PD-(D/E)XK nuclease family protein [Rectinemataceae bacterium]|nr:PD-(D/E)XK nuclease family protein [Rectinemataceae bacterium]